uniref:Major facilitator superfamily (MFS) profile domain-containing protein n=1 Tax=Romanomermis culicivorax TaxID=13658 RepID=A0A915KTQ2_ROMCU
SPFYHVQFVFWLQKLAAKRELCLGRKENYVHKLQEQGKTMKNSHNVHYKRGFGYGISICLQPTYFAEVCDKSYSGFLGAITGMVIEFGFTLGAILALPDLLGTTVFWPWLHFVELSPNILALILLPFLPESPKFLMAENPILNRKLAVRSMQFFERQNIDGQLEKVLQEIETEKVSLSLRQMLNKPYLRRGLFLASVVQVAIVFSGVLPIAYYSTRLFIKAGASKPLAAYGTVLMSLLCFNSALISCFILDKIGRKSIMILTCTALAALNVAFSILSTFHSQAWSSYLSIVVVNLFFVIYGLGPSTVPWFIAAELMPQKARSSGIMFVMVVQWIGLICSFFIYDALDRVLHEWTFLIYALILLSCTFCFWKMMPETRGKDAVEIMKSLGFDGSNFDDNGRDSETITSSM